MERRAPQVPELPRELVVSIALAAKDGRVLATMLQVCRAWRVALTAESAKLWREAALAQFPRLKSLVSCPMPRELNFRELYRSQARADGPQRVVQLPPLSDYILTAELGAYLAHLPGRYPDGVPAQDDPMNAQYMKDLAKYVVVAQASSPLHDTIKIRNARIPMVDRASLLYLKPEPAYKDLIGPEDLLQIHTPAFIRLKFYVTRLSDMATVKIWEGAKIDEDEMQEQEEVLEADDEEPYSVYYAAEFCKQAPKLFANNGGSEPAMRASFCPFGMVASFDFLEYEVSGEDGEDFAMVDMSVEELQRYLSSFAPWAGE